ncbi:Uncharacterised protein [Mycobacterium tuberculosis]|nr:Uncharacterised protein [Mycobacterium tuberculosis]COU93024.1 Uncharacterised protein [Mycobacterium tuberculosis]
MSRRGAHLLALLDHHVRVCATEAERRHTGTAGMARCRPFSLCVNDFHPQVGKGNVRVRGFEVLIWRNLAMLHSQHRLDEARDSSRSLGVTEVGLDRADEQRRILGPAATQHRSESAGFDRVAQQRPCSVRFDVVDLAGLHPRVGVGGTQHRHLGRWVGGHQPVGSAVLVDRRTADHRKHPIPVALCIGQPLEHHYPGTLAADKPVGGRIERTALTCRGQGADLVETAKYRRGQQQIHAGCDCQVTVLGPKALAGQVDRYQRRRACGVYRHRRAAQVKEIREAVGDDAHRATAIAPTIDLRQIGGSHRTVFAQACPGKHSCCRAAQRAGRDSRVLQRFPGHFQQQALLGVHLVGFAGGDLEEFRVEGVDVGQK